MYSVIKYVTYGVITSVTILVTLCVCCFWSFFLIGIIRSSNTKVLPGLSRTLGNTGIDIDAFSYDWIHCLYLLLLFATAVIFVLLIALIRLLIHSQLSGSHKRIYTIIFWGIPVLIIIFSQMLVTLGPGSEDIRNVQLLLKDAGYYDLKLDGKPDSFWHTQNIPAQFRKYQKEKGLMVDGVLGTKSESSLYQSIYRSKIKEINKTLDICEIKTIIKEIQLELDNKYKLNIFGLRSRYGPGLPSLAYSIALMFSDDNPTNIVWDYDELDVNSTLDTLISNTESHCNASHEVHCTDFLFRLLSSSKTNLSNTEEVYDKFCEYPNHNNGYIETGLVIIHSGKYQDQAETVAAEACIKLGGMYLDGSYIEPKDSLGFLLSDNPGFYSSINLHKSQSQGALSGQYVIIKSPCKHKTITIAQSEVYEGLTKGLFIVVTSIKEANDPTLNEDLTRAQELYPDAYIKNSQVYLGCSHHK